MRITTLIEDSKALENDLLSEHGLSFYIEYNSRKILFDTGMTSRFIENARDLGIDLADVDQIFLSHGHYDHGNGLLSVLKINDKASVYAGVGYFIPKYKKAPVRYDYKGVNFTMKDLEDFHMITETTELDDLIVFKGFERKTSYETIPENYVLSMGSGKFVQDDFDDEIALGLKYQDGIVLVVGCSHAGIVNIMNTVYELGYNIKAVIGGSHLINANEERVSETIRYINSRNLDLVSFCHCTGSENITRMHDEVSNFIVNYPGKSLDFI